MESREPETLNLQDMEHILATAVDVSEARKKEFLRWTGAAIAALARISLAMVERVRGRAMTSRRNQVLSRCVVHNLRMRVLDRYGE